ncbi:MAG: histidine utilization repressor [Gammaproteobacteria bacterium]|nr:histidine utilization repressor [Gammaproteobacteria bacterium]
MSAKTLKMELCGDTSVPMYQQIKNAIKGQILSGDWQPGYMIPSENQLAMELGASRMTINRPLRELTAEGLLKRVHGLGTFVAEPPRQASLIELRSIAEEIKSQGKVHRSEVLSQCELPAQGEAAERMGVKAGARLFQLKTIHYQDEVPIQMELRYVNPDKVPGFINMDFTQTTSTDYLVSQIRPDELEHIVQAVMPDDYMAIHLIIPLTEPCLRLKRRTWERGSVVTAVDMIYPSSRYDLGARYQPSVAA